MREPSLLQDFIALCAEIGLSVLVYALLLLLWCNYLDNTAKKYDTGKTSLEMQP